MELGLVGVRGRLSPRPCKAALARVMGGLRRLGRPGERAAPTDLSRASRSGLGLQVTTGGGASGWKSAPAPSGSPAGPASSLPPAQPARSSAAETAKRLSGTQTEARERGQRPPGCLRPLQEICGEVGGAEPTTGPAAPPTPCWRPGEAGPLLEHAAVFRTLAPESLLFCHRLYFIYLFFEQF